MRGAQYDTYAPQPLQSPLYPLFKRCIEANLPSAGRIEEPGLLGFPFRHARPQTSTSPHGATTTYVYTNSPPTVKATINVGNRWTLTTMDGLGRTVKVEQGDSGGTTKSVVDTEYDSCACSPLGKVKRVSQPYAPGGTVYWTTYTYDGLGRTTSVSLPGGTGTTTYLHQGNTVKITDPASKWKKFTTDAMGNLTKVTEPDPAGGADLDSNYTYNMFNQLTQVSMTRGSTTQTRSFAYNGNQQLQMATHPESGAVNYTYNLDGTVATKIDAKNQKVVYTYDSYKRVTQISRYPVSTGAEDLCQRINFTYDTSGYGQNVWGRLAEVDWNQGSCGGKNFTEKYSYSVGGLVLKKQLNVSVGYFWEAIYTYDTEGKMVSVTYPGDTSTSGPGRKYTYTFDSMGRPNKLTDDQATPVDWAKNVSYGPAGELTQMDYFKATGQYYTETRSYNPRRQLTQIRAYYGATDSLNMQYVYSGTQNNGQITQSIDTVSGETVNYTYDSLNRLITAATTGTQWGLSFTYDGFGNRTAQTVTKGSGPTSSLSISTSTNRITTTGYGYDANGNMTTMPYGSGSMTLTYDVESRMTQAVNSNGTEKYAYNAENLRLYQKQPNGTELVYFYGANGDRLRVYKLLTNGAYQVQHTNIYFAGRLIRQDNTTAFVDRLGSVRTNSRYYPYGEEQTATANDTDKFATYFRDSTTGLDYAHNRYYSSSLGRFTTADPYRAGARSVNNPGDPGSWNRYAYVLNDPINHNDHHGLFACIVGAGEGAEITDCQVEEISVGSDDDADAKAQRKHQRDFQRVSKRLPTAIVNALNELRKYPKCAAFFAAGTSIDVEAVLNGLYYGSVNGFFEIKDIPNDTPNSTLSATTTVVLRRPVSVGYGGATQLQNAAVEISINDLEGTFVNGSLYQQQTTVLHELGHAIYDLYGPEGAQILPTNYPIQPDSGDLAKSQANTDEIKKVCP